MFRDNKLPNQKVSVNCLICDGGLGDFIASLPIVAYIQNNVPWINQLVWVSDFLLDFAKHVLPKGTIVRDFSTANKKYNPSLPGITTRWNTNYTCMRVHPTTYAGNVLTDSELGIENKNYLKICTEEIDVSKFNLPDKYVVISVGATSKVKELPVDVMMQIVDYIRSKNYTIVFLGKSVALLGYENKALMTNLADINYSLGIDLREKTTLLEAGAIIQGAKAFIGMEGGLTHLAGCTDVKIIAGYTFIDPNIMMPIRNGKLGYEVYPVIPDASLECRYCQSRMILLYSHDFRSCFYKDFLCTKQLKFDKWKEQIDKIL